jgi:hypothetical protein
MADQVNHCNVTMPEQMFPIMQIGKGRETRCDIPQFGLRRLREREELSAERRMQSVDP